MQDQVLLLQQCYYLFYVVFVSGVVQRKNLGRRSELVTWWLVRVLCSRLLKYFCVPVNKTF